MVIDNCSVIGDAAIQLDGLEGVGATSTIPVVYCLLAGLLAQPVRTCWSRASRRMSVTTATWPMSGTM